jgi:hypothetical protein
VIAMSKSISRREIATAQRLRRSLYIEARPESSGPTKILTVSPQMNN